MAQVLDVGPYGNDAELARFEEIACDAFAFPAEKARLYFESAGLTNIRLVHAGGLVAGGLVMLPMGQWFGGRAVPMTGIAAVATATEHRARGAATYLLRAMLQEVRAAGMPLSTLYPATAALYRRVGYELAGHAYDAAVPARLIDVRERGLDVRPVLPTDEESLRTVYGTFAQRGNGLLMRSDFIWQRVHEWRGQRSRGFVVYDGEQIEGYAFLLTQPGEGQKHNVRVHDLAALTPQAARRLLTLLADQRTTRDRITWRTGPLDPLLMHLAEVPHTLTSQTPWMVRIVDVPSALAARGYAPGVTAEVQFNIRGDDVLPENNGRFVLQVSDGCGRVQLGGRGTLDVHIRGLAALYTDYLAPTELVLAGLARGSDEDLTAASAVFTGAAPWMRDDF